MHIADQDIGGGRVRRVFTRAGESLKSGYQLSADEILSMPVANRRALIDAGYLEVYPKAEGLERFVIQVSKNRYDVIEGRKLNEKGLSEEEANALAAQA